MNALRIAGLVLLVLGILGLAYGGFTYTEETHDADLGPIELSIEDKERVSIPLWLSVAAIVGGGAMVVFGGKKR
jgi:TRAP-type C4-dicarboxylate transport system permease small subunit